MSSYKLENQIARGLIKAALGIAGALLLLYLLYEIRIVFMYLTMAAVLAIIGRPIVIFFNERLRLPSAIASMITIGIFLTVIGGVFYLFKPLIMQQIENFATLGSDKFKIKVEKQFYDFIAFFQANNVKIMKDWINIKGIIDKLTTWFPTFINSLFVFMSDFFIGLLSVLFISFFLLKDRMFLKKMIFSIVPDNQEKHFGNVLDKTSNLLSRYFIGLIGQIFTMFCLYVIILLIFGIKNALIIGCICAFFNLIPYIGPLIGSFVFGLFSMSHFIGLGLDYQNEIIPKTIYCITAFYLAQLVDNFIVQPLIFSKTVRSHPLEIFFIIIIGGILWSVSGMIVAVPIYTAIRVILKEFLGHKKWVQSITKNI